MYKVAVAVRILSALSSLATQSQLFGVTVDVDIAALACLYASRAAAPEPCGPRGTATKRGFPPRGRASPASSKPSPRPHATHTTMRRRLRMIHANIGQGGRHLLTHHPTSRFASPVNL